jgi:hypothetical protein
MTREGLTAELAALDRNAEQLATGDWTAIERDGRLLRLLQAGIAAERARLEQLEADLDSKQVTPRQIERYPVLSPREFKACISDDATESLTDEAYRDLAIAMMPSREDVAAATIDPPAGWLAEEWAIPATLADESHAEVGT